MPKVTRKEMIEQINGQGGREVEITYDVPVLAEFVPLPDLTAYELAQARVGIGVYRTFTDEEWAALDITQARRHWKRRDIFNDAQECLDDQGAAMSRADQRALEKFLLRDQW